MCRFTEITKYKDSRRNNKKFACTIRVRIDKGQNKTLDNADRVTIQKKELCADVLFTY